MPGYNKESLKYRQNEEIFYQHQEISQIDFNFRDKFHSSLQFSSIKLLESTKTYLYQAYNERAGSQDRHIRNMICFTREFNIMWLPRLPTKWYWSVLCSMANIQCLFFSFAADCQNFSLWIWFYNKLFILRKLFDDAFKKNPECLQKINEIPLTSYLSRFQEFRLGQLFPNSLYGVIEFFLFSLFHQIDFVFSTRAGYFYHSDDWMSPQLSFPTRLVNEIFFSLSKKEKPIK